MKVALFVPALVLVAGVIVLSSAGVTLGQGSFAYRWSPWAGARVLNALFALPGIVMLALAVRFAGREKLGLGPATTAFLGAALLAIWTWAAPPRVMEQHYLNLMSPSHEGAFVLEARTAASVREYVAKFPARQALSIDEIRGTRVLSNPPGTTMLVILIREYWGPGMIEDQLAQEMDSANISEAALAFKLSIVLTACWVLALLPLYYAGRLLMTPSAALAAAGCAVFAPSCLEFSPGKDPAQLLIAALALLGAVMSVRCRGMAAQIGGAVLLGAATALGAVFGLLLLWMGLACGVWGIFQAVRGRAAMRGVVLVVGALVGVGVVIIGLRVTAGLDVVATSRAVAAKFAEVQPLIKVDRGTWFKIGLPIAVLFVPAGLVSVLLLRRRITRRTRAGAALLISTAGVMLVTYFAGVPYELPRLWSPFLPLLAVGAFAATGAAHRASGRMNRLMAGLLAVSVVAAVLHWTRLDVRESEYRLASQRLLN